MFNASSPFLYRLSLVVARHRREGGSAACVRPDPALLYPFIQAPSSRGWRLFLYLNPKRITDMTASKTPAAPDVTLRQSARWLPADMDTPISLFLGMCHEHHGILLESAEVDGRWGRYSILACDFLLQAACRDGLLALDTNDDRLRPFAALNGMPFTEGLRTLMRGLHLEKPEGITLPPITRALYGYFGYGMASFFNKKLENCLPQKDADASLVLPGTVLVFDHLYNRLCQISLGEHRDVNGARTRECGAALPFIGEDAVTATPGREGYMDAVNKIKQMLRQGEAIQVVPSCRFSTPFEGDAFTLYRRMRRCNASPYMFFMDLPGITHLVAPMDGLSREEIQRRIRQWNGEIRADALGVLRWDEAAGRMEPIVYVPETDSAVWERGCGSGTAALGAYLARRAGRTFQSAVRQPGGEIVVRAELDGEVFRELTITGEVRITAEGTAFV